MRKQPDQFSNLRTCGALFARSFKSGTFSRNSGRGVLARGGRSFLNLEHFTTPFRVFVISSGYRGLTSVLQNSPSRVSDVVQTVSPAIVSFQCVSVLKRSWRALQCPTKVLKDLTK
ncbi:hypothetical protein J2782_001734 [Brucella pseudogrignonensis]|uniref:Uncharacterized protein n=1 Tax=Brucella pseudogrignonensis TaxID=419475 RepID=A0ABU1M7K4_9HYPH|nr:hypothetical protein [Brucella pseudogrignonensis]